MTYNLLEEPWIPVLWSSGTVERVGIKEALTQAGRIRQFASSNPMDNVSLLRFLLAVLRWCKPSLSSEERASLKDSNGVPEAWLMRLGQQTHGFGLFGAGKRFYQFSVEADEKPDSPSSYLFGYLPSGIEINHFWHVYDRTVALCPACCALGLLRLSACATQGGQGKSPSINNAPPNYFLPHGNTLLETFLLNWPLQDSRGDDHTAWDTGNQSQQIVGVLEGFTWQPRAVQLGTPTGNGERRCSRCGARVPLVSKLAFKSGRSRSGDRRAWRDPLVALSPRTWG